jgi:single stranded DNA-binding protein (ssb)
MAGSVNKVILIGNLARDPEVRTFHNGGKVCNLSIATSDNWCDRNTGERPEHTEWHTVAIFSAPLVRVTEQDLRKGAKVYMHSQLETQQMAGPIRPGPPNRLKSCCDLTLSDLSRLDE